MITGDDIKKISEEGRGWVHELMPLITLLVPSPIHSLWLRFFTPKPKEQK